MNISNDLFQIAGFFEKYRETGGLITPSDARFLGAYLGSLAEGARAMQLAHKAIGDEFDAFIETNGGPVDKRPERVFALIEGGLA